MGDHTDVKMKREFPHPTQPIWYQFLIYLYVNDNIRQLVYMVITIQMTFVDRQHSRHVCFVFERTRTPRHFLLGKRHPMMDMLATGYLRYLRGVSGPAQFFQICFLKHDSEYNNINSEDRSEETKWRPYEGCYQISVDAFFPVVFVHYSSIIHHQVDASKLRLRLFENICKKKTSTICFLELEMNR